MKTIKLTFEREDDAREMYYSTTIQSMIASKDISASYNNTHPNDLIIKFNEPYDKRVFEAVFDLAYFYCFYN